MKVFSILVALVILFSVTVFTQTSTVDILYLKNGSIIRGQVIELSLDNIKIKTSDGSLFVYTLADLEKMVKEITTLDPASVSTQPQSVDILSLKNGSIIRGQVMELNVENVKIKTADGSLFVYTLTDLEKMVKETIALAPAPTQTQTIIPKVDTATRRNVAEVDETLATEPELKKEGVSFGLAAGIWANLGLWDQLKGNPDSRLGFGLMGTLLAGIAIDDEMFIGVGPHFGGNFWSQSKQIAGYNTTATINVADVGPNFGFAFDGMYAVIGFGSGSVSVTATVGGSSETVKIPNTASYSRIMIGFGSGFSYGISYVSYSGWAKHLSRGEINLGYTF